MDGIPILLCTLIYLVVVGGTWTLVRVLDSHSRPWAQLAGLTLLAIWPWGIFILLMWLGFNWEFFVEWFKLRLTYPRTGYVAPPSRWRSEPQEKAYATHPPRKLRQFLDFLGGFWLWLWLPFLLDMFLDWKPSKFWLIGTVLTVRAVRYAVYSEDPARIGKPASACVRSWRFVLSVANSFWLWFWTPELLRPQPSDKAQWLWFAMLLGLLAALTYSLRSELWIEDQRIWLKLLLCSICVGSVILLWSNHSIVSLVSASLVFGIYWAHRMDTVAAWLKLATILSCVGLCIFFASKNTSLSVGFAFLLPGIFAASYGAVKLLRYLRANPVARA